LKAGKLRHKLTIQNYTITNTYGTVTKTWATYATTWGSIEPLKGKEFFESAKENAELTHRIRIRYTAGITTKMRVIWNSKVFEIMAVIDKDEKDTEYELMCKEDQG